MSVRGISTAKIREYMTPGMRILSLVMLVVRGLEKILCFANQLSF